MRVLLSAAPSSFQLSPYPACARALNARARAVGGGRLVLPLGEGVSLFLEKVDNSTQASRLNLGCE